MPIKDKKSKEKGSGTRGSALTAAKQLKRTVKKTYTHTLAQL